MPYSNSINEHIELAKESGHPIHVTDINSGTMTKLSFSCDYCGYTSKEMMLICIKPASWIAHEYRLCKKCYDIIEHKLK